MLVPEAIWQERWQMNHQIQKPQQSCTNNEDHRHEQRATCFRCGPLLFWWWVSRPAQTHGDGKTKQFYYQGLLWDGRRGYVIPEAVQSCSLFLLILTVIWCRRLWTVAHALNQWLSTGFASGLRFSFEHQLVTKFFFFFVQVNTKMY